MKNQGFLHKRYEVPESIYISMIVK